jgi:hypothetical protein
MRVPTLEIGSQTIETAVHPHALRYVLTTGASRPVLAALLTPLLLCISLYSRAQTLWYEADSWRDPSGELLTVAASYEGNEIVTGSSGGTVRLRNVVSGKSSALRGHTDAVNDVAYDPKGRFVASAGKDRSIRLWNLDTRRMQLEIHGTRSTATAVAIDAERDIIIGGGSDNVVRFFDLNSGGKLREYGTRGGAGIVRDLLINANGAMVLVSGGPFGSPSTRIHGLVIERGSYGGEQYITPPDEAFGAALARSADGSTFVLGGDAGTLVTWSPGKAGRRLMGHVGAIHGVAVSPAGDVIATAGADATVRLWDTDTGELLTILEGHSGAVNDVVFAADGSWLVSVGSDRTTRQWRPGSGAPEPVVVPEPPRVPILSLARGDIVLRDGDGDGALTADESGALEVLVQNVGTAPAVGYQVEISPDALPNLVYEHQTPLGDVAPGGSASVTVNIRATQYVASMSHTIDVLIRASDGAVAESATFMLATEERREPDVVVVDYAIDHVDGARIGGTTHVTVTVRNRGSAVAEDVVLSAFATGVQVSPVRSNAQMARGRSGVLVGDLAPSDLVDATFSVTVPPTFGDSSLTLRVVAEEATGAYGVAEDIGVPVWAPPAVALVVTEAELVDADPDGVLAPGEPASLRLRVVNKGVSTASRVRVVVRPAAVAGLTYMASIFAGDLAAGESNVLTVPIGASDEVVGASHTLSLVALDASGGESAAANVRFRTRSAVEPELRVVSVLVDGEYEGAVTEGDRHTIKVSVANDGTGVAEGVSVAVTASTNGALTDLLAIGARNSVIQPGAAGTFAFVYAAPPTLDEDAVGLRVHVGERRAEYGIDDLLTVPVSKAPLTPSRMYALIVGGNRYENHADLVNPVGDTRAIAAELEEAYGATVERIENPTRGEFLSSLYALADREYAPADRLFVMFSGHGHYDDRRGSGFLAFTDSAKVDVDPAYSTYVSHENVRSALEGLECAHVLWIADSCFDSESDPRITMDSTGRADNPDGSMLSAQRARRYVTAGGREYLPDNRPGRHSPFVRQMLEALRSYGGGDGILTLDELLLYLRRVTPSPRSGELAGNAPGSSFAFATESARESSPSPSPAVGVVVVSVSPPDADITIGGDRGSLSQILRTLVTAPSSGRRRYRLPVGLYRLRVSRDGYSTDERELRILPGTSHVTVTLQPQ